MTKFLLQICALLLFLSSCSKDEECICETFVNGKFEKSENVDPAEFGVNKCKELDFALFGTSYKCK